MSALIVVLRGLVPVYSTRANFLEGTACGCQLQDMVSMLRADQGEHIAIDLSKPCDLAESRTVDAYTVAQTIVSTANYKFIRFC